MPLRLEIKKKLTSRSERVKCVDLHPSQPLVLAALYSGSLMVWNYETQTLLKSFEATTNPIRCAKFIVRKQWIVSGSDDMMIRIYNYNTLEKVIEFEAHLDYIRSLEVHSTLPYILSASDDFQVKLWDWDRLKLGSSSVDVSQLMSSNSQTFEGHSYYIMCIKFNPKDTNTFATASLDKTVKIWSLGSPLPNYSLEGHEQGVNAVDYFIGGEKPYLVSAADDMTVKIWDYQTKSCVQTLGGPDVSPGPSVGHTGNVSSVIFHPRLPLIVSGSEDGTVRLWHSVTYRLETTLNYGMERVWCVAASKDSNKVAIAFDEGMVVLSLGSDEVLASMENINGKVLLVKNNDVSVVNVRKSTGEIVDGETMNLAKKDLGTSEIYPQSIMHNSNGRFVALVGDGEYIIYTAQALRNKAYGQCLDFAWSSESTGDYALLKSNKEVRIVRNFDESNGFDKKLGFAIDKLQTGPLLGMIFGSGEFVVFMDWETGTVVRKIDVSCSRIVWNNTGSLLALISDELNDETVYFLSCNQELIADKLRSLNTSPDSEEDFTDAFEDCFDLVHELTEKVGSGVWVGDCFLYVNKSGTKLNYHINGETVTLSNLDRKMFLLNYVAKEDRVYLIDQNQNVVSYELLESVLQYQTAVVRGDFDLANQILPTVPVGKHDDIARFLDSQNYKEVALEVAKDFDLRFELAIGLNKLDAAFEIMNKTIQEQKNLNNNGEIDSTDKLENQSKYKQLCDLALQKGELKIAEDCALLASDFSSLFLLYSSIEDVSKLEQLSKMAFSAGDLNVAFSSAYMISEVNLCVDILLAAERFAEAAFFARTYAPSRLKGTVEKWKLNLESNSHNPSLAASIANIDEHPSLFGEYRKQTVEVFPSSETQSNVPKTIPNLPEESEAPLLDEKVIEDEVEHPGEDDDRNEIPLNDNLAEDNNVLLEPENFDNVETQGFSEIPGEEAKEFSEIPDEDLLDMAENEEEHKLEEW